jgi:ADP-ribose pyrophosphatase
MTDSGRASIYRGRLIELGLETAELPNGATIELEIVRHPGGAVVLALDEGDRVCLLR